MCVTFEEEGEMSAIAKIFDLLLVALKGRRSTSAPQSAGASGLEQERTENQWIFASG